MIGHGANRVWLGDFTNCVKEVEWRGSANPLSIMSGEVPGKLKSPQIMRRSAASISRLVRSKPNSSKNNDTLEEGGGRCSQTQCPETEG